jgi:hypothetical protein
MFTYEFLLPTSALQFFLLLHVSATHRSHYQGIIEKWLPDNGYNSTPTPPYCIWLVGTLPFMVQEVVLPQLCTGMAFLFTQSIFISCAR